MIAVFVEEMKPVVAVKDEVACRDKSKELAEFSDYQEASDAIKKSKIRFFNRSPQFSS